MMPRRRVGMEAGGRKQGATEKSVYACDAAGNVRGLDPSSAKPLVLPSSGRNRVDNEGLKHLLDAFRGQIEENVIHMVLSECDWKVELAADQLCQLASEPAASDQSSVLSLVNIARQLCPLHESQMSASSQTEIKSVNNAKDGFIAEGTVIHEPLECSSDFRRSWINPSDGESSQTYWSSSVDYAEDQEMFYPPNSSLDSLNNCQDTSLNASCRTLTDSKLASRLNLNFQQSIPRSTIIDSLPGINSNEDTVHVIQLFSQSTLCGIESENSILNKVQLKNEKPCEKKFIKSIAVMASTAQGRLVASCQPGVFEEIAFSESSETPASGGTLETPDLTVPSSYQSSQSTLDSDMIDMSKSAEEGPICFEENDCSVTASFVNIAQAAVQQFSSSAAGDLLQTESIDAFNLRHADCDKAANLVNTCVSSAAFSSRVYEAAYELNSSDTDTACSWQSDSIITTDRLETDLIKANAMQASNCTMAANCNDVYYTTAADSTESACTAIEGVSDCAETHNIMTAGVEVQPCSNLTGVEAVTSCSFHCGTELQTHSRDIADTSVLINSQDRDQDFLVNTSNLLSENLLSSVYDRIDSSINFDSQASSSTVTHLNIGGSPCSSTTCAANSYNANAGSAEYNTNCISSTSVASELSTALENALVSNSVEDHLIVRLARESNVSRDIQTDEQAVCSPATDALIARNSLQSSCLNSGSSDLCTILQEYEIDDISQKIVSVRFTSSACSYPVDCQKVNVKGVLTKRNSLHDDTVKATLAEIRAKEAPLDSPVSSRGCEAPLIDASNLYIVSSEANNATRTTDLGGLCSDGSQASLTPGAFYYTSQFTSGLSKLGCLAAGVMKRFQGSNSVRDIRPTSKAVSNAASITISPSLAVVPETTAKSVITADGVLPQTPVTQLSIGAPAFVPQNCSPRHQPAVRHVPVSKGVIPGMRSQFVERRGPGLSNIARTPFNTSRCPGFSNDHGVRGAYMSDPLLSGCPEYFFASQVRHRNPAPSHYSQAYFHHDDFTSSTAVPVSYSQLHHPSASATPTPRNPAAHISRSTAASAQHAVKSEADARGPGAVANFQISKVTHDEVDAVLRMVADGTKVCVIMRGVPGSGKTTLAKHIQLSCISARRLSADDFFLGDNGTFMYEVNKLQEAHTWCKQQVANAMQLGSNPVIIDNTNTRAWEMIPFVHSAELFGYKIVLLEPGTPWMRKARDLERRNVHGVSVDKIRSMLHRYEDNVTPDALLAGIRSGQPKVMLHASPSEGKVKEELTEVAQCSTEDSTSVHKRRKRVKSKKAVKSEPLDPTADSSAGGARSQACVVSVDPATPSAPTPISSADKTTQKSQSKEIDGALNRLHIDVSSSNRNKKDDKKPNSRTILLNVKPSVKNETEAVVPSPCPISIESTNISDCLESYGCARRVDSESSEADVYVAQPKPQRPRADRKGRAALGSSGRVVEDTADDAWLDSNGSPCDWKVEEKCTFDSCQAVGPCTEPQNEKMVDLAKVSEVQTPMVQEDLAMQNLQCIAQSSTSSEFVDSEKGEFGLKADLLDQSDILTNMDKINIKHDDLTQTESETSQTLTTIAHNKIEPDVTNGLISQIFDNDDVCQEHSNDLKCNSWPLCKLSPALNTDLGDETIRCSESESFEVKVEAQSGDISDSSELKQTTCQEISNQSENETLPTETELQILTINTLSVNTSMLELQKAEDKGARKRDADVKNPVHLVDIENGSDSRILHEGPPPLETSGKLALTKWLMPDCSATYSPPYMLRQNPTAQVQVESAATWTDPADWACLCDISGIGSATPERFVSIVPTRPRVICSAGSGARESSVPTRVALNCGCSVPDDLAEEGEREGGLAFLAACFPTINDHELADLFTRCGYDVDYTASLFLDCGYEYNEPTNQDAHGALAYQEAKMSSAVEDLKKGDADALLSNVDSVSPGQQEDRGKEGVVQDGARGGMVGSPRRSRATLLVSSGSVKSKALTEERESLQQHLQRRRRGAHGPGAGVGASDRVGRAGEAHVGAVSDAVEAQTDATAMQKSAACVTFSLTAAMVDQLIQCFGPMQGISSSDFCTEEERLVQLDLYTARLIHQCWTATQATRQATIQTSSGAALGTGATVQAGNSVSLEGSLTSATQVLSSRENELASLDNIESIMLEQQQLAWPVLHEAMASHEATHWSTLMKRQRLQELYSFINPTILEEIFQASGYSMEVTCRTVEGCEELMARPRDVMTTEAQEMELVEQAITNSLEDQFQQELRAQGRDLREEGVERGTDYSAVRSAVYAQYRRHRACVERMQQARGVGRASIAAHYAQQAHACIEELARLRRQAASLIVRTRDTDESQVPSLDLHGLSVKDAIHVLSEALVKREQEARESRPQRQRTHVNVITGRGQHSAGGVARLRPAAIEYLQRHNYAFTEKTTGQLKVRLQID